MKVTIFYFSGTGNTWYAANRIKDSLNNLGADAQAISIEDSSISDKTTLVRLVDESDKIVIGYPIYGSKAPEIMIDFINQFPETQTPKAFSLFSTVALYSGDGAVYYSKVFIEKGYEFESGFEFISNNNFNVPNFPNVLKVGDDKKVTRKNDKVANKATKMADSIVNNKSIINGGGIIGRFMGKSQRKYIDAEIRKMNNSMYVEHSKCINCVRCVKMCPVENISRVDGKIEIKNNCIACMRCYHFCPTNAINITEKSLDIEKWPRYKGPTKDYVKTLL